jgi:hypothetical protein
MCTLGMRASGPQERGVQRLNDAEDREASPPLLQPLALTEGQMIPHTQLKQSVDMYARDRTAGTWRFAHISGLSEYTSSHPQNSAGWVIGS